MDETKDVFPVNFVEVFRQCLVKFLWVENSEILLHQQTLNVKEYLNWIFKKSFTKQCDKSEISVALL